MEISNFKKIDKNTLMGTFNLKIPKWGNFIIREMSYFKKGEQRWVSFPCRGYENKEGEKKYFNFCMFEDASTGKSFSEKVLEALDQHLKTLPEQPQKKEIQEEIPF